MANWVVPQPWGTSGRSDRCVRGHGNRSCPPAPFWVQRGEPLLVERVDHLADVVSPIRSSKVMSRTVWPWADINTTTARRAGTGSFAVRETRASLRSSSIDKDRTNKTRPTPHHQSWRQSRAARPQVDDPTNDPSRALSLPLSRQWRSRRSTAGRTAPAAQFVQGTIGSWPGEKFSSRPSV